MRIILFILLLVLCYSCYSERDYYSYSRNGDLYRFPLIEPYEIVSSDRGGVWGFSFVDSTIYKGTWHMVGIDTVGIIDEAIVIHGNIQTLNYGHKWVYIDTKTGEIAINSNRDRLNAIFSIENYKVYSFSELSTQFMHDLSLPNDWKQESGVPPQEPDDQ